MILGLAPMEGVIDPVIRDLYTRYGSYDFCVSEFIRVTHQLLPAKVFYRYIPELQTQGKTAAGVPVFGQLLGSDPQCLVDNALRLVELGVLGIDINFGCPAKTVNRHSGGAKLLENPSLIFDILSLLRKELPSKISLSAKIRLGYLDTSLYLDILKSIEASQADWLTIHARTKLDAYKPPAHWHKIAEAQKQIHIPILANGDIWNCDDYEKCKTTSKTLDAVLGRGAFAKLDLAHDIKAQHPHQNVSSMEQVFQSFDFPIRKNHITTGITWADYKKILLEFLKNSYLHKDEKYAVSRFKQWAKFLGRNFSQSTELFEKTKGLQEQNQIQAFLSKDT